MAWSKSRNFGTPECISWTTTMYLGNATVPSHIHNSNSGGIQTDMLCLHMCELAENFLEGSKFCHWWQVLSLPISFRGSQMLLLEFTRSSKIRIYLSIQVNKTFFYYWLLQIWRSRKQLLKKKKKKVRCLVSLIFQQRKMSAVTQVDTNNLLDALSGPNDKASLLIEW